MQGSRADKVVESIKEEISNIVDREIKDPRIGFVTITHVELKDDLRYAKVFFSKMGTQDEKKKALKGLESATGFIRKLVAERLDLRYAPEIVFKLDESAEYSQHIEDVLKKIKEQESPPKADSPTAKKPEKTDVDKEGN